MNILPKKVSCLFVLFCFAITTGCAGINTAITSSPSADVQPQKTINQKPKLTRERYGQKITYYDFFSLPDNVDTQAKIELPEDLAIYVKSRVNSPTIDKNNIYNQHWFEADILEEMHRRGYDLSDFAEMNYHDAIFACVKVVASRIKYNDMGNKFAKKFNKKYGRAPMLDDNFYHRTGDCDIYRDLTIVLFNYIKKINPRLNNIYLLRERLGGNLLLHTEHAWVAILIPQENRLLLSHIDPTFYDVYGWNKRCLESDDKRICRGLNDAILRACFYRGLEDKNNLLYAYEDFEKLYRIAPNRRLKEFILDNLTYTAERISHLVSLKLATEKFLWILAEYDKNNFVQYHDEALYNAYLIFTRNNEKAKAESVKIKLLKKYPRSSRTKHLKNQ